MRAGGEKLWRPFEGREQPTLTDDNNSQTQPKKRHTKKDCSLRC